MIHDFDDMITWRDDLILDLITHKAGILDYLPEYVKAIITSLNDNIDIPNPINSEDFFSIRR